MYAVSAPFSAGFLSLRKYKFSDASFSQISTFSCIKVYFYAIIADEYDVLIHEQLLGPSGSGFQHLPRGKANVYAKKIMNDPYIQSILLSFLLWFNTNITCELRYGPRQANLVLIAYASAQSRQNLRCSLIQAVSQEEPSDRKPDPWPLWMAGHAQLKFVMTECSKTQIRLTGLI